MKGEIRDDPELSEIFAKETGGDILAALKTSERGQRFIEERLRPYQREFGWHAVWSHEFVFPSRYEQPEPILEVIKGYVETDYDYPAAIEELKADLAAAGDELLAGLEGEALERMRLAHETNARMAPLTPDHHFYIDQGTNAHVRLVLMCIGRHLASAGAIGAPDDVIFLKYNELRYLMADPEGVDMRELISDRRDEREYAYEIRPRHRGGPGLPIPSPLGIPRAARSGLCRGGGSGRGPGCLGRCHRGRGQGRVESRAIRPGRKRGDPRLSDDQPGLGDAVHQDQRPGLRRGRSGLTSGSPVA
jgi:pyruvate,water dikinase